MTLCSVHLLEYAGPTPPRRIAVPVRIVRTSGWLLWMLTRFTWLTARLVMLTAGFILVVIGTILLGLGGRRAAAQKTRAVFNHWIDLLGLWATDISRPFREWRARHRQLRDTTPAIPLAALPDPGQ
jgi:hypothetical protein